MEEEEEEREEEEEAEELDPWDPRHNTDVKQPLPPNTSQQIVQLVQPLPCFSQLLSEARDGNVAAREGSAETAAVSAYNQESFPVDNEQSQQQQEEQFDPTPQAQSADSELDNAENQNQMQPHTHSMSLDVDHHHHHQLWQAAGREQDEVVLYLRDQHQEFSNREEEQQQQQPQALSIREVIQPRSEADQSDTSSVFISRSFHSDSSVNLHGPESMPEESVSVTVPEMLCQIRCSRRQQVAACQQTNQPQTQSLDQFHRAGCANQMASGVADQRLQASADSYRMAGGLGDQMPAVAAHQGGQGEESHVGETAGLCDRGVGCEEAACSGHPGNSMAAHGGHDHEEAVEIQQQATSDHEGGEGRDDTEEETGDQPSLGRRMVQSAWEAVWQNVFYG
jgi:hypothetical protein